MRHTTPVAGQAAGRVAAPDVAADKLGAIFASLDEGLLVLDERLVVESVNRQAERILALGSSSLVGRSIDEVAQDWPLRDRGPFAVSKMRHHLLRGIPYRNDEAFVVVDDTIRHVSLVMTPVQPGGERLGAVVCLRDITELKLTEHRLRESERQFRRIFAAAPVGMVQIAPDGTILATNESFALLVGLEATDLSSRTFEQLADGSAEVLREVFGDAGAWQGDLAFRHADGGTVSTVTSLAVMRPEPGGEGFAVAVVEDQTERRRLEIELRHAQKLEAVGRLAAGVAHELNTPIQFISDNVRFMAEAFDQLSALHVAKPADGGSDRTDIAFLVAETPLAAREALEGIDRVATIVAAMRSFGSPGEGERSPTDINELIRTTLLVLASQLRGVARVELELGQLPHLSCWAADIRHVVVNLVSNAAEAVSRRRQAHAEPPASIIVATRPRHGGVEITVSDAGDGMSPEVQRRALDPFFTTKPVGQGTGQGLALVHALVQRHGGQLTFESELGVGSAFHVWLPLDRAERTAGTSTNTFEPPVTLRTCGITESG